MNETQYISSDFLTPRDAWDKLSIEEQAAMMKTAISEGILDLGTIRQKYNEFAEGGNTDDDLVDWIIREEGFLASPQDIGDGKMTLGSGLTAQKWHDLYKRNGNKWTSSDNRRAVREEVANRRRWAEKNIPNWDSLPSSSQKALLSYKYNYDFNQTNSPKLFKALADSNLQEAARQMDATSSNPTFKKGLQDRRQREQEWFLRDVVSPQVSDITYQPAVSTQVYNPYVQQVEATRMLPINEPDPNSYIRTREVSPQEQRRRKFQENVEAYQRFNALMNLIDLRNNPAPSYSPIYSLFGEDTGEFANGGKIHIKPENRGKFTALKERTGHSATWFKEHGTPAQKKMAVFALNSRHWKHGLGGNLFDGTTEDSQKMQIGLKATNGWKPYTLDDILANAARIEQQKQAMEDRLNNVFTLSNDATAVANGRPQNRHLERKAVEGAKAHRAWEEEHPNLTAWGNLAGATPFIVPILAAGLPLASSAGSTIAATLQTSAPFLYNIGRIGLPWLDRAAATYFGYEGAKDISQGKFTPSTALDVLPLVGKATSYAIKESSKIPIYRNLEKNYTGVPHNQSKDLNGNLQFYSDGSPIYMDSNFPFVHNQHTVWTSNDVDYSKLFATPDKLNQPIGTVFDVYTNPKKLSILDTPIPSEGESFYWQGLPFELKNGKISIVADIEKVPSGVARSKDISIKKGGETGKYNQDELSSTIFRKKDVGTLNWDKNPSAIKTDDIVDFSKNHGYDAVRFHNIEDGPSLINGKWHYYPIDELVLNPNAEKFVLPHGAPKFWLWNQLPSKNLKSPSGFLPLLNYKENDE